MPTILYVVCVFGLFVASTIALVSGQGKCTNVWIALLLTTIASVAQFVCIWWADLLWLPWELASGAFSQDDHYFDAKRDKMSHGNKWACGILAVLMFGGDVGLLISNLTLLAQIGNPGALYFCADTTIATYAQIRAWFQLVPYAAFLVVAGCGLVVGLVVGCAWCRASLADPRSRCRDLGQCLGESACCAGLCCKYLKTNIQPPSVRQEYESC